MQADPMTNTAQTQQGDLPERDTRELLRPLTDIEVATRLGVSRFTVRAWRHKGQGPRFLKMGRAVRYRLADIEEYQRTTLVETHTSCSAGDSAT